MPKFSEILDRASAWLETHADEMAADLADFVKIRSVSRADLALAGAPFGAEVDKMLKHALFRCAALGFETKNGNGYYGTVTLGDRDNSIGMIAHLDVVPEGDNWIYPPYAAVREGDFLFGRGSQDNKGSAIACLYVMRMVKELDIRMRHGLRLILGTSEETGMQDMAEYNRAEKPCAMTLVADSAFPVCYAQKGSLGAVMSIPFGTQIESFKGGEVDNMVPPVCECVLNISEKHVRDTIDASSDIDVQKIDEAKTRLVAHGAAAHAANPTAGKSAIHMLSCALCDSGLLKGETLKAIEALAWLSQGYFGEHVGIACEDADTGKTTMVVGIAKTRPDGKLEAHIDCRLSVSADIDKNRASVESTCREHGMTLESIETTQPISIAKDDPRVVLLQDAYNSITGDDSQPYTMGGGTYSRCLKDAITFGLALPKFKVSPENLPEGHGGAHSPDEYVHLPSLRRAALIYLKSVLAADEAL